jgi:rubredoxin
MDPQARPAEHQHILCPKCGRPGRRVTGPGEPLPQRRLTTLAGAVTLSREKWRCTTCRVVFFPPGPDVAARDRGLQPGRPA